MTIQLISYGLTPMNHLDGIRSLICFGKLSVTGYLAIALGALAWWFGITFFVNKVRTQFNLRGIWILNRIIGSIVIVVSVLGLVFTLMGESLY